MATTQEYYRLGGRVPRYTTKLNAFANGMYLTKQIIPEGYVKAMVNYDIDDTGSHIKPRRGRTKLQTLSYDSPALGPVSLTDYVYSYNKANNEVEDIKDLVMSYGMFVKLTDLVGKGVTDYNRPIFVSSMTETLDTNVYYLDEDGNYIISEAGSITNREVKEFWALYYDKNNERFVKIENKDIGYVTARTIENAYAFDKPFKDMVGRPVGTVLNNELIAFTGTKPTYKNYTANPERNELLNFTTPVLTKFIITNEGSSYSIKRKAMEARNLNPLEALSSGYNILAQDPYVFEDVRGGAISVLSILLYEDSASTKPIFTPRVGQTVNLRAYYQYPASGETLKYKVETLDLTNSNSSWVVVENFTKSVSAGNPINYVMATKATNFLVRITLRKGDDTTTEYPFTREIDCGNNAYDDLETKKFDLSTCKGMISWQGCVGVYGVDNARDTIFFSDVEDPSYFPFPNNTLAFDNEILYVHNYLDYLLVITVDSLWLVTGGGTIAQSKQKRILANINIPEIDAINAVVLKDQIFFKTDNQFYVLKPNQYTSDATDLKNYINSTAIANYTENFRVETVSLLNEVYKPVWQDLTVKRRKQIRFEDFDVLDTRSIVRNEEVHYVYTIVPKLTDNIVLDKLNLHLVYNTLTRSWRIYFNAIGNDSVYFNPILYRNKQSGAFYEFFPYSIGSGSRLIVAKQTYDVVTDDLVDGVWNLTNNYNNYPYIDTGNISIDDTFTKRFREVQLNLVNMEHTMIKFFADFKLDGQERVHATRYEMQHITDPNDPDYGHIYVTPIEHTNLDLAGMTTLADSIDEAEYWALDISKFPELDVATVRFTLQGRGRRGSLQLLNTSLKRYQLSDINWVYRNMSAR